MGVKTQYKDLRSDHNNIFMCLELNVVPTLSSNFFIWANVYIPNRKKNHIVGLAAVCWALWDARNMF